MNTRARPAFYALRPGGWRDYVTLLHPPYTLWHLSYVALGAAFVPRMDWPLLGWTMLAFFLAMGVGAHALDELQGRPLQTLIPARVLVALAAVSIGAACAIGCVIAAQRTLWLLVFVAAGGFIVVAYNLELFGGALHGDVCFAAAWGAFPVLTAYFAAAHTLRSAAVAAAIYAFLTSWVQRTLSTPVRAVRRKPADEVTDAERAIAPPAERALQMLAFACVFLGAAALLARA
ncbi:MAG: hypothetical protein QOG85_355 [Gaiellaceae bacterium]|nr:hypothetical protein [Gaiellaceae bacterium]